MFILDKPKKNIRWRGGGGKDWSLNPVYYTFFRKFSKFQDQKMASKSVETIFFGFWKNYASHVDNIISPHKRKNILFACLHLTSAVLNLVKCDVGSSESIEMAGEVLRYLILICSIKKADFLVKVVSKDNQDAVTRSDLLELLNDIDISTHYLTMLRGREDSD